MGQCLSAVGLTVCRWQCLGSWGDGWEERAGGLQTCSQPFDAHMDASRQINPNICV